MVQRMRARTHNLFRFPVLLSVLRLSTLGRIDTANAQGQDTLVTSPTSVTFLSPVGGPSQTNTVQVGSTAGPLNFAVGYQSAQNFFVAYSSQNVTPGQVTVVVTPGNLGIGTYSGTITLTPSGGSTQVATVPVNLVISNTSSITVSPSTMSFSATAGSTTPTAPQPLSVNSATNGINFSTTISYTQGSNWLSVNPTFSTTNATLAVTANPSGLAAGTYSAIISVSTGQGINQTVNVSFTVTGTPDTQQ